MIKAIFLDLDRTLLNSKKQISPKTRQTLERCREKGLKLFVATARPPLLDKMLSWNENTMSLFDGGIYYNGACVIVGAHKEYVQISGDVVRDTVNLVCSYDGLNIALQMKDEKHAFRYELDEAGYKAWGVTSGESLELTGDCYHRTVKMLIFYSNLVNSTLPLDGRLACSLTGLCRGKAQLYLADGAKTAQITGNNVNKYYGVEKIRSLLGFEKDEIAVFGDDVNDAEMLSEYKNSFSMGNAEACIKEMARYTTLDNNNDGIHHAICNILKLV